MITGGLGFIGSNFTEYVLKNTDWTVRIFDNSTDTALLEKNEDTDNNRVTIIEGDIKNKQQIENAVEGCDFVVHLAAQVGVIESIEDPLFDAHTNVIGTINMLNACKKYAVKRVVLASSAAPLGEQEPPVHEQKVPRPLSPYGASKLANEAYASAFAGSYGLRTIALRFSNVYGPKSTNKTSAVSKFIKQIVAGEQITIYGDGKQTRDLIHTHDISTAIYLALTKELKNAFSLFQLGTGKETSVNTLFSLIEESCKKHGISVKPPVHEPARAGEILRNYSDISLARKELGFEPDVSIEQGIDRTVTWFVQTAT